MDVVLALHVFLGRFHGNGGVAAIGIGADGLARTPRLSGAPPTRDDIVVANAPSSFIVSMTTFHVGHGRGQQSRHADDVGLVLLYGREIVLRPDC